VALLSPVAAAIAGLVGARPITLTTVEGETRIANDGRRVDGDEDDE